MHYFVGDTSQYCISLLLRPLMVTPLNELMLKPDFRVVGGVLLPHSRDLVPIDEWILDVWALFLAHSCKLVDGDDGKKG